MLCSGLLIFSCFLFILSFCSIPAAIYTTTLARKLNPFFFLIKKKPPQNCTPRRIHHPNIFRTPPPPLPPPFITTRSLSNVTPPNPQPTPRQRTSTPAYHHPRRGGPLPPTKTHAVLIPHPPPPFYQCALHHGSRIFLIPRGSYTLRNLFLVSSGILVPSLPHRPSRGKFSAR